MFFSSPKAVEFFLQHVKLNWFSNKKVGCIGQGTHQALVKNRILPDFSGKGEVKNVAQKFNQIVGNKLVLFPIGKHSRRTVQSEIPLKQVKELIIYKTEKIHLLLDDNVDALVFTSPSNVQFFLESNSQHNTGKTVIAIGSSTSQVLADKKIPHLISQKPTELDLAERLIGSL